MVRGLGLGLWYFHIHFRDCRSRILHARCPSWHWRN